jgi:hypothetical protein
LVRERRKHTPRRTRLTSRQTPGIDEQTDYGHIGPFVQVDFRDRLTDPHRGGTMWWRYVYFHDDELFRYSFRRLEASIEQYIPVLNEKRVFALRAQTDLSFPNETTLVPFYMQPTLGGSMICADTANSAITITTGS